MKQELGETGDFLSGGDEFVSASVTASAVSNAVAAPMDDFSAPVAAVEPASVCSIMRRLDSSF